MLQYSLHILLELEVQTLFLDDVRKIRNMLDSSNVVHGFLDSLSWGECCSGGETTHVTEQLVEVQDIAATSKAIGMILGW